MSDLDAFLKNADKKSKFIKFEDGVPVEGTFKGAQLIDDPFNEGKQTMEYSLEVDGVVKTFKSASTKLARLVHKFGVGSYLQFVKTGSGLKTFWYVDEADKEK